VIAVDAQAEPAVFVRYQVLIYHDSPLFRFLETSLPAPRKTGEAASRGTQVSLQRCKTTPIPAATAASKSRNCAPEILLRHVSQTALELSRHTIVHRSDVIDCALCVSETSV
jgi:hypothetical protein